MAEGKDQVEGNDRDESMIFARRRADPEPYVAYLFQFK